MRSVVILLAVGLLAASCSPEADVAGTTSNCAAKLYSPYNRKNMNQCVNVCIACDKGTMTTCTTSCTLKGAS
jgi:hypothetical protein